MWFLKLSISFSPTKISAEHFGGFHEILFSTNMQLQKWTQHSGLLVVRVFYMLE